MTVAQSAKETEAEGLRCAQPEGEASNMRASEDILERAKTSLKRHDPINQGFYTSMPPEDVQIWKELIAEVEAKNDKIVQDAITIQMHHNNVLALQKDVERWKSAYYRERELCPFPDSDCSRIHFENRLYQRKFCRRKRTVFRKRRNNRRMAMRFGTSRKNIFRF